LVVEDEEAISATDLETECHLLLAQVHRALGDRPAAQRHIAKAAGLVDAFAAQFPEDIKRTYLARGRISRVFELREELQRPGPPASPTQPEPR
ncbi:MAG TPA: hypothetical protein VMF29_06080, partial [Candidatus Edwardsbacteria bacterium]|nr:hypothetical protein [Candidatus Edwardsbacteria bacterium]